MARRGLGNLKDGASVVGALEEGFGFFDYV